MRVDSPRVRVFERAMCCKFETGAQFVDESGPVWPRYHAKHDMRRCGNDSVSSGNQLARDVTQLRRNLGT